MLHPEGGGGGVRRPEMEECAGSGGGVEQADAQPGGLDRPGMEWTVALPGGPPPPTRPNRDPAESQLGGLGPVDRRSRRAGGTGRGRGQGAGGILRQRKRRPARPARGGQRRGRGPREAGAGSRGRRISPTFPSSDQRPPLVNTTAGRTSSHHAAGRARNIGESDGSRCCLAPPGEDGTLAFTMTAGRTTKQRAAGRHYFGSGCCLSPPGVWGASGALMTSCRAAAPLHRAAGRADAFYRRIVSRHLESRVTWRAAAISRRFGSWCCP